MRASRLLSILILLQLRGRMTAEALAEEFEVSIRTVYRDVDALSAAGVPVYGDRGPGGGFQLLDGYRTRLTGLAADEAEAMFMIGMPGPAAALGLGAAAARAGGKLLAALSPPVGEGAGRIGTRFHLDPVDWYHADEAVPFLPAIARAVLDQQAIEMTYESWSGLRDWRVEPLGLVLKAGAWYLVATARRGVQTFRVSNIRTQQVTEDRFERPADFDLSSWWAASLERFETELRPARASIRLSALGRRRLAELGAYAAEAVAAAGAPDENGWAIVSLPIETADKAALTLLGLGPEVRVIEPVELRDSLRDLAEQVMGMTAT
ncbi:helix-turn-helix transcriptional regulator [Sphingomonas sp.]|uniref:helix-turn-helix transcriptional regulator n=1 Tax=Sphingomonas sp. TaxID=28214 RepID=UPI0035645D60